ncbi:Acetyltransferase (GNAT) family protein [Bizionia echini]|uniref:Acetyltransferase (GNAT) family protein n=1 Tax=Bizionia echini TaxID=649333 RepID=A0A1I5B4B2_9FLAO|nr:GNAT family N-acetyltransferase [Bizionia echini]SFN69558.1 Acetyltransferase (GNAT) family protein [Bizionia echini]
MITIIKADVNHAKLLSEIGKQTFIESHGMSAPESDITNYIHSKFTKNAFLAELSDKDTVFHILYYNNNAIGYSKIVFNVSQVNIPFKQVTKLERLYVLKEFHDLKLGKELFHYNVSLSKRNNQFGMWLYVWIENQRAFNFYKTMGFKIIGSFDFKISETHSNPNHQMLLTY